MYTRVHEDMGLFQLNQPKPFRANKGAEKTRVRLQGGADVRWPPVVFTESKLWIALSAHMRGFWRAVRIETGRTALGVSDVSFCANGVRGWLELKCHYMNDDAPRQIVYIPHLTREQRDFIISEGMAAGHAWLLVMFLYAEGQREIALLAWTDVADLHDRKLTLADVRKRARIHARGGVRLISQRGFASTLAMKIGRKWQGGSDAA